MSNDRTAEVADLVRLIRANFQRLRALGDALHADRGITASMRAVMESLAEHGAQTVPQMAERKDVSRQHIQVIVDALLASGLVAAQANPRHRRSAVIDLTAAGRSDFAAMRRREAAVLRRVAGRLPRGDTDAAIRTLQALGPLIGAELKKEDRNDE